MCVSNWLFNANFLPHSSHKNVLSSLWTQIMCDFRLPLRWKHLPQCAHSKFLFCPCTLIKCFVRLLLPVKMTPQCSHESFLLGSMWLSVMGLCTLLTISVFSFSSSEFFSIGWEITTVLSVQIMISIKTVSSASSPGSSILNFVLLNFEKKSYYWMKPKRLLLLNSYSYSTQNMTFSKCSDVINAATTTSPHAICISYIHTYYIITYIRQTDSMDMLVYVPPYNVYAHSLLISMCIISVSSGRVR